MRQSRTIREPANVATQFLNGGAAFAELAAIAVQQEHGRRELPLRREKLGRGAERAQHVQAVLDVQQTGRGLAQQSLPAEQRDRDCGRGTFQAGAALRFTGQAPGALGG